MKHSGILLNESFCKISWEAHTKRFPPPWTRCPIHGRNMPALQEGHEGRVRAPSWGHRWAAQGGRLPADSGELKFPLHLNYENSWAVHSSYIIFPVLRDHSSVSTFQHSLINFWFSSFSWSVKVKANRDLPSSSLYLIGCVD